MTKISLSLLTLALLAASLTGCSSSPGETFTISEQQAGETVEMQVGDTLRVRLPGNITTGFNWYPASQDPELLEQVGEPLVTPASGMPGAPGTIVLEFRAIAAGETVLRLEYQRGWEADIAPESSFEVTVVVR